MQVANPAASMFEKKLPPQWLTFALLLPTLACGDDSTEADPSEASSEASGDGSSGTDGADPAADESTSALGESTDGAVEDECGNGIVDPDEVCDDGELNGSIGACTANCQGQLVVCGDGLVQGGEACDDGNAKDGDGCNRDCRPSGAVVWEHVLPEVGNAYGVHVGADGTIYLAGHVERQYRTAWAAGLTDADGAVEWTYELPSSGQGYPLDGFYTVTIGRDGEVVLGGSKNEIGRIAVLDRDGAPLETLQTLESNLVHRLAMLPDGDYLVSDRWNVSRVQGLFQEWQTLVVGQGLSLRPGENTALVTTLAGAGFRRITLFGDAFELVMFPAPEGFLTSSWDIARTSDGDVVVVGDVWSGGARDALVVRSSLGGQQRWMHGPQQLEAQDRHIECLAVDSQDAIIVGGFTRVFGPMRPYLMKLSPDGEVLWQRWLELEATDGIVYGCTTTANDEVVAVGEAAGQVWAAKLTP